ncbi:hypothetical protein D1AOALGA4SA_5096 [Olavius algarvensis Delta 1 endosymbiont]|nr:hypothetical protein D1AOALGA4SA_5096 [Olavius algarvensis Delta 1 endosymbiont]
MGRRLRSRAKQAVKSNNYWNIDKLYVTVFVKLCTKCFAGQNAAGDIKQGLLRSKTKKYSVNLIPHILNS